MTVNAINGSLFTALSAVDGKTLSTLTAVNGLTILAGDPNFSSVKLLLHFNGADGATTSTDSSLSGHTLTFNSNAQLDTAQAKFGASSLLLALTDDTVTIPDSADWHFGLGDFTIEFFARFNSMTGSHTFICQYNNVGNQRAWLIRYNHGATTLECQVSPDGSSVALATRAEGTWTPSTGVWYHICAERASNVFRVYVDGVVIGTGDLNTSTEPVFDSTQALMIGAINSSGVVQEFDGWIDEVRITKGVARYNGAFTPPSAAFPDS